MEKRTFDVEEFIPGKSLLSWSISLGLCVDCVEFVRECVDVLFLVWDMFRFCYRWALRSWRRFRTDWKLPPTIFGVQTSQNLKLLALWSYRQFVLKRNGFTEWIFPFLHTFQTISKKGWVETLFFYFNHFS